MHDAPEFTPPTADNEMRAAKAAAPACGSGVPPRARRPRPRLTLSALGGASARGVARGALASPSPSPNAPPPPPVSIRVIYEDDDLLAVDKPCGLSFHSDDLEGVEEGSNGAPAPGLLATIRAAQRSGSLTGSDYRGALHSVHRLDKVTSGITLFAKNKATASHLGEQFRSRRVHKYYVALSARKPSKKMGTVAGEMTRARRGAWRLVRSENKRKETPRTTDSRAGTDEKPGAVPTGGTRSPRLDDTSEPSAESEKPRQKKGSPATTKFVSRGLRKPGKPGAGDDAKTRALRFLILRPLTGRTHQLRVACKSLGAPILGDAAYAGKDDARNEDRAYLHAAAVRVALPAFADDDESRVVAVVCKPSFGSAWSDSRAFDDAWDEAGFGVMEKGDADVWFEGQALLRSSASELL
jgi:tRNA pseudouridine32 synthase/23S rRNA pseudouridine746 synthase